MMDKKQWLGGLCGIMTGIFWGFVMILSTVFILTLRKEEN